MFSDNLDTTESSTVTVGYMSLYLILVSLKENTESSASSELVQNYQEPHNHCASLKFKNSDSV